MVNKYYHKHEEKLQKEAPENYQNLSKEDEKKFGYMWNYYLAHKK